MCVVERNGYLRFVSRRPVHRGDVSVLSEVAWREDHFGKWSQSSRPTPWRRHASSSYANGIRDLPFLARALCKSLAVARFPPNRESPNRFRGRFNSRQNAQIGPPQTSRLHFARAPSQECLSKENLESARCRGGCVSRLSWIGGFGSLSAVASAQLHRLCPPPPANQRRLAQAPLQGKTGFAFRAISA